MTEPLGFCIMEDAFWDDPRFEQRSDLAQKLYMRLWAKATSQRVIGLEISDLFFDYLVRRFRSTDEQVEAALLELSTPIESRRRGKKVVLKPLIRYDGRVAVMLGIAKKHRTVRRWHDEDKYPEEIPSKGNNSPSTDEIPPETEEIEPSTDNYHPSPSPERERKNGTGTERERNGTELVRTERSQPPEGGSIPREDGEPPDSESPPSRSMHPHSVEPRRPEAPPPKKRPLPEDGPDFIRDLYSHLCRGDGGLPSAFGMLKKRFGMTSKQFLQASVIAPQMLCEYLYAAWTEGDTPIALFVRYIKTRPDFRGTHIYEAVKKILFEPQVSVAELFEDSDEGLSGAGQREATE